MWGDMGLGLFFLTWWMIAFGGATREKTMIGQIYNTLVTVSAQQAV